jgi:fused signal recognition particle receptor
MIKWFKRKKNVTDQAPGPEPQDQAGLEPLFPISQEGPTAHPPEGTVMGQPEDRAAEPPTADLPGPVEPAGEMAVLKTEAEAAPATPASADRDAGTAEPAPEERRPRFFRRLRERLSKTRQALGSNIDRLFLGHKTIDLDLLDQLEELLITADLGVETSTELIERTREKVRRRELMDPERLKAHLKEEMLALLMGVAAQAVPALHKPHVVMVIGVNGVGKTTTIAKLAHHDTQQGQKVLLVAADTFRAAAVEQLDIWGQRVGVPVIKQKTGSDPAAVVYDGLQAALARGIDKVYIDTAGRLHTKVNLMEELKKIRRTAEKKIDGAPHEVLLVLDATTGQNAISQARLFHDAIGITGLVITKLDGTAKGGVALGVVKETGLPIQFIGVGEQLNDLRPFDPNDFLEAILG